MTYVAHGFTVCNRIHYNNRVIRYLPWNTDQLISHSTHNIKYINTYFSIPMSGRNYSSKRKQRDQDAYNQRKQRTTVDPLQCKPLYTDEQLYAPNSNTLWVKPGPKKHVALLIAYNGTAYSGLQIQNAQLLRATNDVTQHTSIEAVLLHAIWLAGLVSPYNKYDTQKLHFMRAARTDKGVHAVSNLISLELHVPTNKSNHNNNTTDSTADSNNDDNHNQATGDSDKHNIEPTIVSTTTILSTTADSTCDTTQSIHNDNSTKTTIDNNDSDTESTNNTPTSSSADIAELINKHLPDDIHVLGWLPVSKSFHAKNSCTSRVYEYLLPASILCNTSLVHNPPPRAQQAQEQSFIESLEPERFGTQNINNKSIIQQNDSVPLSIDSSLQQPVLHDTGKLITPELRDIINNVCSYFIGTHNYYNLVRADKDNVSSYGNEDPGAYNRFIMNMYISDVFVHDSVEFVVISIHGQSFMYNQIRKMIGLLVGIVRGINHITVGIFNNIYTWNKYHIPTAPALGLLLNRTIYRGYDLRCINNPSMLQHESLEHAYQRIAIQTDQFKRQRIYTQICTQESSEHSFDNWLQSLGEQSFTPVAPDYQHIPPQQQSYNKLQLNNNNNTGDAATASNNQVNQTDTVSDTTGVSTHNDADLKHGTDC